MYLSIAAVIIKYSVVGIRKLNDAFVAMNEEEIHFEQSAEKIPLRKHAYSNI